MRIIESWRNQGQEEEILVQRFYLGWGESWPGLKWNNGRQGIRVIQKGQQLGIRQYLVRQLRTKADHRQMIALHMDWALLTGRIYGIKGWVFMESDKVDLDALHNWCIKYPSSRRRPVWPN